MKGNFFLMCQISWCINGLKNGLQTQHTEWVVGGCYILFQGKSDTFFWNILILRPLKGQTTFLWPISYIFLGHASIYNALNHIKSYTYTRTCQKMQWRWYSISFQTIWYASQKMALHSKFVFCLIGPESSLQNLITLEVSCNLVKNRFLNQYWEVLWNTTVNILAKNPYSPPP